MFEICSNSVISAPAKRVWALLRDFNAMPEWNAAAKTSVIESGPPDRVGCRRVLTFDDGSAWTHELTSLSDAERIVSYAIVGAPPGRPPLLRNYSATIRVRPVAGDETCMVEWQARFDAFDEKAAQERATAVIKAGFDGLKRYFAR